MTIFSQRKEQLKLLATELCGPNKQKQYKWLLHHLEDYIERWLAFEKMAPSVSMKSLVENESFLIIRVAVNLLFEIAAHDAIYQASTSDIEMLKETIDETWRKQVQANASKLREALCKLKMTIPSEQV